MLCIYIKKARGIPKFGQKAIHVFVDMKKAFDRVPRKVMEWSMRQSCLPKDADESNDEPI